MRWCPSARTAAVAELLGVFATTDDDDRVTWLPEPVPVDDAARGWLADQGGETRFRFAAPCVTSRCTRWSGRCEVGAGLAALAADRRPASLPACGVRDRCRWWAEQGAAACVLCPLVRTATAPSDGATTAQAPRP